MIRTMAESLVNRPDDDQPGRLAFMVRAFRHRNYRLFFGGQIVSLVGTFLSQVAIAWMVYRLTYSSRALGITLFAGQIPMFVLAPFGGVWVDRVNRQRLLVITQTLSMLQSFTLAAVAFSHWRNDPHVAVPCVVALAFVQGLINAIDMPGRQAFLVEMVTDRNDLANAIAMNSTMVHGARLIGPAAAGILIYYVGEGLCFTIDGFSYLAVIAALVMMRIAPRPRKPRASVLSELHEGWRYVWGFLPIRVLLLSMAVLSLSGGPAMQVLMPIFGEFFARMFGNPRAGSQMLGFLSAASGVGALVGAVYLASRQSVVGLGRVIAISSGLMGVAFIAFSFSRHLSLSLLLIAAAGMAMIVSFAASNTVLQTLADEDKRGRVMSFFAMAFLGMAPFGSLMTGELTARFGHLGLSSVDSASWTMRVCGCISLLTAAVFASQLQSVRRVVRPIYVEKGILSDQVASGLQTATEVVATRE